jgi:hypothetical protein
MNVLANPTVDRWLAFAPRCCSSWAFAVARSSSLDCGFPAEETMNIKRHTRFVREGSYAAEVDVELIEEVNGWSPYLSLDDARKLDAVRESLRSGDVEAASRLARVFSLTPVCG